MVLLNKGSIHKIGYDPTKTLILPLIFWNLHKILITPVNTEVILEIAPGIEAMAIITKTSVEKLGLNVGKEVYAVIKSSDVMVAID